MEIGKALEHLDQVRRERYALGQLYDELLDRADRRAASDAGTLDESDRLLVQQLAAALRTERDHAHLLLELLVDAYERLLAALGVRSGLGRAA